jgi:DNA invertase Pin-like site-specific DNA recombinase
VKLGSVVYPFSGAAKERKALDQLMDDAKKRKFDIVLVWKFDRFARSLKMLVDSLALFQELGIDFISFKENIDTTTSMGRLIFHINSAYAEFEREIIKDRVIAGIKAKREKTGTWGRKVLAGELQQQIKDLIAAKQSIRTVAKALDISTRTVRKYKGL